MTGSLLRAMPQSGHHTGSAGAGDVSGADEGKGYPSQPQELSALVSPRVVTKHTGGKRMTYCEAGFEGQGSF